MLFVAWKAAAGKWAQFHHEFLPALNCVIAVPISSPFWTCTKIIHETSALRFFSCSSPKSWGFSGTTVVIFSASRHNSRSSGWSFTCTTAMTACLGTVILHPSLKGWISAVPFTCPSIASSTLPFIFAPCREFVGYSFNFTPLDTTKFQCILYQLLWLLLF